MSEIEFIARWEKEEPIYAAWGAYVVDILKEKISERVNWKSIDDFLKVPAKARVKDRRSLINKAFYRPEKDYSDPYNQITDKVGTRFVVLHYPDIEIVAKCIEGHEGWTFSPDKHFQSEQEKKPEVFGYQSVHYVVKAASDVPYNGFVVPQGTPCEIQIRTLLQHAHSETTHDTIYKPHSIPPSSVARRLCARSMALIETADDLFVRVAGEIARASEPLNRAMETLEVAYRSRVGTEPETAPLNTLLIDAYLEALGPELEANLSAFLDAKPFVAERVAERGQRQLLFRQPAVLLIYYLAEKGRNRTKSKWPLTPAELQPIYDDLGLGDIR